ncbi:hypothetical protein STXM2123_3911 [Streptomyces sp. F-3]|nr:hypothetical protein STXM2123_3911 [Streptomyces sp. F-3]
MPARSRPKGEAVVPAPALLPAAFVAGLDRLAQWTYGTPGPVGPMLPTAGVEAKSPALGSAGAVVPTTLLAGPAL